MSSRRRRVLVLAEAANPEWTSVPLIGWSLSRALAVAADVHLVTHIRNREALLRAGLAEGSHFTVIDNEAVARPLWKISNLMRGGEGRGWTTMAALSALAYYSFERKAWRKMGARLESGEFELVHRITPLSPSHHSQMATWLAKRNIPFVLGPLNGGLPWPKNFSDRQMAEREYLSSLRAFYKLLPGYHSTLKHSAAIIAGSRHFYDSLPSSVAAKRIYLPENAVDMSRLSRPRERKTSLPLKVAFVGRLVPLKCVDLLIEATCEFQRLSQVELIVIGDGPERSRLETMVSQLGLARSTRFEGWLPHVAAMNKLRDCDALALPSIREFGGGVVLEAMALGVAPIVADYGGPAELVVEGTGIRVPFYHKTSLRDGLTRAFAQLITSPERLDALGARGRERALKYFTWEAKADQIVAIYDALMAGTDQLSSLGLPLPPVRDACAVLRGGQKVTAGARA